MNRQSLFFTDTATLAIFDPERLSHRAEAESGWWCFDFPHLDELQSGACAIANLRDDGVYRVRITDGALTPEERDYAASAVHGLGVEIVSGQLFVGPAECLPGGGCGFTPGDLERGLLLEMENGRYDIDLYRIVWSDSPRWWRDDDSVPDDAPPDIVAVLRPRLTTFAAIETEPRLDPGWNSFLFESTTRRIGPEPGMVLTTKVRRGPSNELCLKECGPGQYRASLVDSSGVAWKDTIRLRVLRVDHSAKQIIGEFVEKATGPAIARNA